MSKAPRYDVVVLGGGPAGCACALSLRRGWPERTVAVVEASRYEKTRAGEVLAAQAMGMLRELGVQAEGLVAQGVASSWGGDGMVEQHPLFSAQGFGLHLDRRGFDRGMAAAVERSGARMVMGSAFLGAWRDEEGWGMELRGGERMRARFVVDATGRRAAFARGMGAGSERMDRLTAYSVTVPVDGVEEHTMVVEACAMGWWYTAPLPGGRRVVSLLTDVDLARAAGLPERVAWDRLLGETVHLGEVRGGGAVEVAPAATGVLLGAGGDGWVATGDAAATYDPLAGQGITKALRTGMLASYVAVESLLGREVDARRRYEAVMAANLAGYRRMHRMHYARETRWAGEAFWRRRHGALDEVAA